MNISVLIRSMAAAGATPEAIAIAVEAIEGVQTLIEEKKAAARDKKRLQRAAPNNTCPGTVPGQSGDMAGTVPPQPLSLSPNENNSNPHTHTPENKPRARKEGFVLPSHIPALEWAAYVEMRARIRKPMTPHAMGLAVDKLDKLAADGWPPGDVLNHATMNSNQGLWPPPKDYQNGRSPQRANGMGGHRTDASGADLLAEIRDRREARSH